MTNPLPFYSDFFPSIFHYIITRPLVTLVDSKLVRFLEVCCNVLYWILNVLDCFFFDLISRRFRVDRVTDFRRGSLQLVCRPDRNTFIFLFCNRLSGSLNVILQNPSRTLALTHTLLVFFVDDVLHTYIVQVSFLSLVCHWTCPSRILFINNNTLYPKILFYFLVGHHLFPMGSFLI